MWLHLSLEGIELRFRIQGYYHSNNKWDEGWSQTDVILQSGEWLNYRIQSQEIMLMSEVDYLRNGLSDLLSGKIAKDTLISFCEPDLEFCLFPIFDKNNRPDVTFSESRLEMYDLYVDLTVRFYEEGVTGNRLVVCLDPEDVRKLVLYLRVITKEMSANDCEFQKLIEQGIVYGDVERYTNKR